MIFWSGPNKNKRILCVFLAILLLFAASIVSAHAPLGTVSNEDIGNATMVPNPEKSYVIYSELHEGGEAQYYHFPMTRGEVLSGSLEIPGPGSMVPNLVIIGPGINSSGTVPSFIEVPTGSGTMVVEGVNPGKPTYEPFSPQPIYEVAHFNTSIPADGDYYIAVYGPQGGKYSLAPGFQEQFTLSEWLYIPISVFSIHLWEGQSLFAVLVPMLVIIAVGLSLFFFRQKNTGRMVTPIGWTIILAGLLYIGGAAITTVQMFHTLLLTGYSSEVILTFLFIVVPVVLGIVAIWIGTGDPYPGKEKFSKGTETIVIGFLGFFVWAGLIIGPVLAFLGGLLMLLEKT